MCFPRASPKQLTTPTTLHFVCTLCMFAWLVYAFVADPGIGEIPAPDSIASEAVQTKMERNTFWANLPTEEEVRRLSEKNTQRCTATSDRGGGAEIEGCQGRNSERGGERPAWGTMDTKASSPAVHGWPSWTPPYVQE